MFLAYRAIRYLQHGHYAVCIGRFENMAVQKEKQFDRDERSALVAVDERVIAGQAIAVRRRTGGDVGFAIGRKVLRPRQG